MTDIFQISPIGYVRSPLTERSDAPRQGNEGAPDAEVEILEAYADALDGISPGQDVWLLTWLHQSDRSILKTHPRNDKQQPLSGVFATRSPDRPNPIGLHRTTLLAIDGLKLHVNGLEAVDGTPVIDIKPVLHERNLL